jgi:hypothetical protein
MQRFQRTFRLGLWKYHKGSDLMGNNYVRSLSMAAGTA